MKSSKKNEVFWCCNRINNASKNASCEEQLREMTKKLERMTKLYQRNENLRKRMKVKHMKTRNCFKKRYNYYRQIRKPLLRDSLNVLCTIVVNFWQCHNITPLGATTLERYAQQSSRKIAIGNFISRPISASIDRYNKARRIYSRTLFSIRACE